MTFSRWFATLAFYKASWRRLRCEWQSGEFLHSVGSRDGCPWHKEHACGPGPVELILMEGFHVKWFYKSTRLAWDRRLGRR